MDFLFSLMHKVHLSVKTPWEWQSINNNDSGALTLEVCGFFSNAAKLTPSTSAGILVSNPASPIIVGKTSAVLNNISEISFFKPYGQ